jgi:hypothetical protein
VPASARATEPQNPVRNPALPHLPVHVFHPYGRKMCTGRGAGQGSSGEAPMPRMLHSPRIATVLLMVEVSSRIVRLQGAGSQSCGRVENISGNGPLTHGGLFGVITVPLNWGTLCTL